MYHAHSDQSLCTGEDGKWAGLGSRTWNTQSVLQNCEMWNTQPDFLDCVSFGKDIYTESFICFYLAFPWISITLLTLIVNEICFSWLKQSDNIDMVSCSRCLPLVHMNIHTKIAISSPEIWALIFSWMFGSIWRLSYNPYCSLSTTTISKII